MDWLNWFQNECKKHIKVKDIQIPVPKALKAFPANNAYFMIQHYLPICCVLQNSFKQKLFLVCLKTDLIKINIRSVQFCNIKMRHIVPKISPKN